MSFLKKFDPFAVDVSNNPSSSGLSEGEAYMKSLAKQKAKEKLRQQKLFERNVRRQLQAQILKEVYGVKVQEDENYSNGSIPMSGIIPASSRTNSSAAPELSKGIGERSKIGGFVNQVAASQSGSFGNTGVRLKRF